MVNVTLNLVNSTDAAVFYMFRTRKPDCLNWTHLFKDSEGKQKKEKEGKAKYMWQDGKGKKEEKRDNQIT